jgi:hypothetical protein
VRVGQLLVRDQTLTRHYRQCTATKEDGRTVLKSVLGEPNARNEFNRNTNPRHQARVRNMAR